jgi:hypothetical protein
MTPSGVQTSKRIGVREWLSEAGVPQEELAPMEEDMWQAPIGSDEERRSAFIDAQCDQTRKLFEAITNADGTGLSAVLRMLVVEGEAVDCFAEGAHNPGSKLVVERLMDAFGRTDRIEANVFLAGVFRLIVAFGMSATAPPAYGLLCGALSLAIASFGESLVHVQER